MIPPANVLWLAYSTPTQWRVYWSNVHGFNRTSWLIVWCDFTKVFRAYHDNQPGIVQIVDHKLTGMCKKLYDTLKVENAI